MDRVTDYAKRVVAGEGTHGELHVLACQRHVDDLMRQGSKDFPFWWDPKAAQRAIDYFETLQVIEGFGRHRVTLQDCQAFDVGCTFGWLTGDGFWRFRTRYKSMSRQQGKSFENGGIGTYIAGFSGYQYGKLFTAATKKRQSRIVWEEMAKFIRADPRLLKRFTIKDYKNLIIAEKTHCTIEALSKEAGLDDGFRPIFASLDELHQMKDNSVYKALDNGTRDLDQSLISMITTRGFDVNSFAYEMDSYAVNILRGVVTAERFFADIYALDDDDDPFDERVWIKSNPRLASTEKGMERLREDAQRARDMGGQELRDFLTKSMNIWVTRTENSFVDAEQWKRARTDLTLEDFRGERCWIGVDLSSGGDLTTVAIEFEHGGGAYVWSHSFMPRGRLTEHVQTDLAPYDLWEKQGLITVTGGETDFRNDYKLVIAKLAETVAEYELDVQGVGYDPHNADAFTSDLEQFGAPLIKVVQSAKSLNDATVDLQLLVKSDMFAFDKANELLSWSFVNARLVYNSFGECKVDKMDGRGDARHRRIDPVDACIDAHFARIVQRDLEVTDVDAEMRSYLDMMGWS
ncbi:MAG: terminase large subunit [Atopobiaceae bacterium]|nr:terminase large subunit [Atopobiaceae bacterium]